MGEEMTEQHGEIRAHNLFGPTYLNEEFTGRAYPKPRVRKALPLGACFVPRFVQVGSFWVPHGWLYNVEFEEAALKCPVRGPLLRRNPAPDLESLVELGVLELSGALEEGLLTMPFSAEGVGYRPEVRAYRRPDTSAFVVFASPRAVLLVPRRKPRPSGARPDLRDVVEIVCVSWEDDVLVARPLAACWRFPLAWGPALPEAGALLRAIAERDAGALTRPTFLIGTSGDAVVARLARDVRVPLDPEGAELFLGDLYSQHSDGHVRLYSLDTDGEVHPTPVLRIDASIDADRLAYKYTIWLTFQYGGFRLDALGVPGSVFNADCERFIVRDLDTESFAEGAVTKCLGNAATQCRWALTMEKADKFRKFADDMRTQCGWSVEYADYGVGGDASKRLHGLGSEAIFREVEDMQLDVLGELHFQRYDADRWSFSDGEAEAVAQDLLAADAARPDSWDRTPEEEAAWKQQMLEGGLAFKRGLSLGFCAIHWRHLRLLEVKRHEIVRLSAVAQQTETDLAAVIESAEDIVALRGHRLQAHQRDALRLLLRRLHLGTGAILALPVGYGKTLVALLVGIALRRNGVVTAPVLWIGTKSTLVSLRGDLAKFLPDLRVTDFTGPDRVPAFDDVDLVMTSYDIARRDTQRSLETLALVGPLVERTWGLTVVDEVSIVVNPSSWGNTVITALRHQSERVLLLNATMLENTAMDVWSHLEIVAPEAYEGGRFVQLDTLAQLPGPELDHAQTIIRRDVYAYTVDEKQCRGADATLPPLTWRAPVMVPLSAEHAKAMQDHHVAVIRWARRNRSAHRIIGDIVCLRRACHGPRFLGRELANDPLTPRAEAVADLVAAEFAAGHQSLVFTSWVDTLNLIVDALARRGLAVDKLVGATDLAERTRVVEIWSDGRRPPRDTAALVMQVAVGGRGLNLVGADRVIFAEPLWNPGAVHQCVGRAHRKGQFRPVEAVMVRSDAVIEAAVLRRAERKQRVFDAVFGGPPENAEHVLASWVAQHQMLGTDEGMELPEAERVERIRWLLTRFNELTLVAEARLREEKPETMTRDQRIRWHEDLRIELLCDPVDGGDGELYTTLIALGGKLPVRTEDIASLWAAFSGLWRLLKPI